MLTLGTILMIFKTSIGFIFTSDEAIVGLVSQVIPVVALFQVSLSVRVSFFVCVRVFVCFTESMIECVVCVCACVCVGLYVDDMCVHICV